MRSYCLSPHHPASQFVRTIRVEGREPRLVKFTVEGTVELDDVEAAYMADEIGRGIVGKKGAQFPKPPKLEPPRLLRGEMTRDENFDPIEESTIGLSGWRRCLRDLARRVNGSDRF